MRKNVSLESKSAWYVYTLADPFTGKIFYIGKGSSGRVNQHELDAANPKVADSAKLEKIRQIWTAGAQVAKSFVAYFWDEQAAYDHETDMISDVGLCNLTNVMPGGQKAFDRRVSELKSKRAAPDFYLSIADMRRETIGQAPEFMGMYLNLMIATWDAGGQLQGDDAQLSQVSGATPEQWAEHRVELMALFVRHGAVWTHAQISEQLLKSQKSSQCRTAASKKANATRWGNAQIAKDAGAY